MGSMPEVPPTLWIAFIFIEVWVHHPQTPHPESKVGKS
jgi:hypothetical protein